MEEAAICCAQAPCKMGGTRLERFRGSQRGGEHAVKALCTGDLSLGEHHTGARVPSHVFFK
jgi:hypothetical protein